MEWRKSRFSQEGDCVEWRFPPNVVELRNSRDPEGSKLIFTHSEWRAFLAGVNAGDAMLPEE
ncbi:DUF397 domain-containing protein [Pseudonocardia sp. S2-4]|uniref:DUF397 domain-containing protein n=2 Tax=Pseudonocardia humida TaxID=2800819 RepID=A0ABT1A4E7_9PSEU|nr:DUF397 domain-containing protein [Pseudonocardia humida]